MLSPMASQEPPAPRRLSAAEKLRAAERLYWSARQLKEAALRAHHPEWSEATIRRAVRDAFLYGRT
jgi:hypothetical protein